MAKYKAGVTVQLELDVDADKNSEVPDVALAAAEEIVKGHKIRRIWWEYFFAGDKDDQKSGT